MLQQDRQEVAEMESIDRERLSCPRITLLYVVLMLERVWR